jgi:hypothetical protein
MFVRAPNPIWYMVDLTGLGLNDQYYAFFLTNTLPYLPQNVYMDDQGMTVWTGDVIQFYPNGTLPDNLYFDPTLVYRIEIRMGPTQYDPLIYEINNFVPPSGGSNDITELPILFSENQITNPNFANISFTSPFTITNAGTYTIGPGWQLVLSGSGSITITQIIYSGIGINTSPNAINYAMQFNSTGWSQVILQQTLNGNGAIYSGGAANMSCLASAQGAPQILSLVYQPSDSGVPTTFVSAETVNTGNYQIISGTMNLPISMNTDLSNVANINLQINLPPNGNINITDVQFVGQDMPIDNSIVATINPEYHQQTEERSVDHSFHYYANSILVLPKSSLLCGWNFSLNPYQFWPQTLTTVTNNCQYTVDQTILFSHTASSIKAGLYTASNQRTGFQLQAVGGGSPVDNRFALIQYIDTTTIGPYWGYALSSLVRMAISSMFGTQIRMKMRLIYRTTLPPTLGATEPIASWADNADPVFSAGWTAIAPMNDIYFFIQPIKADTTFVPITFNNFILPPLVVPGGQMLGIVLCAMDTMNNTIGSPDNIIFDKISLVPNTFALDTPPETYDESLRKCQFYYESSYDNGLQIGKVAAQGGAISRYQNAVTDGIASYLNGSPFDLQFNTVKRTIPLINLYSPMNGTINTVDGYITGYDTGTSAFFIENTTTSPILSNNYSVVGSGSSNGYKGLTFYNTNSSSLFQVNHSNVYNPNAFINFHYSADARLGVGV